MEFPHLTLMDTVLLSSFGVEIALLVAAFKTRRAHYAAAAIVLGAFFPHLVDAWALESAFPESHQ
ncbi:MAG: hypothetical protein AAB439_01820 [Patescibacteria group bacterium]